MPQEIAGGFLTCSYVTREESGFAESSDFVPVGCAIQKNGEKITDPNLAYKVGLYFPNKMPDTMDAKVATASSKWHGYGNLPRANKTKHFLGITLIDKQNNRPTETVYFPVKDLEPDSQDSLLRLVGDYVPSGNYNMEESSSPEATEFARLFGMKPDNKKTPILPAASCAQGVKRPDYDLSQFEDLVMTTAQISEMVGNLGVESLKQNRSQAMTNKPKAISCFVPVKEARKNQWKTPVGTPKPVLEGEGCLFLQSSDGFVIFDQAQIAKYNIKKESLERYVKARMCADAE
jgi:hypothetical protein